MWISAHEARANQNTRLEVNTAAMSALFLLFAWLAVIDIVGVVQPSGNRVVKLASFIWPSSVCYLVWTTGFKGFVCTSECIADSCPATMAIRSPKMSSPSPIFSYPSCGLILSLSPVTRAPSQCLCCCSQPFAACLSHAGRSVTPTRRQLCFFRFYFLISVIVSLGGSIDVAIYA